MAGTTAYAAKRALFDRLAALTATGQPLEGIQVGYSWPGSTVERVCVYGGGVTFSQEQAAAEWGTVLREVVTVGVHIRVSGPDLSVEDTDLQADSVADAIGDALQADPHLAGNLTFIGVAGGQGDYQPSAEDTGAVSILSLRIQVEAYLNG